MISKEAERIHKESLIVEGHRDVFEMVRLKRAGEHYPVLSKIVPRLKKGGVTVSVFAICGDAVSHANGTYRYLHAALENIDALRREAEASGGKIKFILSAADLPTGPVDDTVYFLLSFEGGKPLEGRLEYLRTFYQLECACRPSRMIGVASLLLLSPKVSTPEAWLQAFPFLL